MSYQSSPSASAPESATTLKSRLETKYEQTKSQFDISKTQNNQNFLLVKEQIKQLEAALDAEKSLDV
jgi:hypothetical protein